MNKRNVTNNKGMNDKIEIQVCEKSSFHLSKLENIFTKDKRIEVKHNLNP